MKQNTAKADFASFAFSPAILKVIKQAGFESPTDIQREAIPAVLAGRDVLARADTGTGKTAAFILPLLDKMCHRNIYDQRDVENLFNPAERARDNCIQVLILVPTRELTIQIAEVVRQFSENIKPPLKCLSVYGGVKINPQMMDLCGGQDVLVATPGRLLDLIDQNAIKFNRLKALVIDEVDRLLKGDFEQEIVRIRKLLPNQRQNLMFSATFPDSIRPIVRNIMRDPEIIDLDEMSEQVEIDQHAVEVNHDKKDSLLAHLLNENDWEQVLIFCSAKRTCDNLVVKLEKRGIVAIAMHGNKRQAERESALRDFKAGETRILIATDVAARGLDIESLPCVINFDLPRSPNDYVHRIGRTARAGLGGTAITLIAHHEYTHFRVIEKRNDILLPREQVEGFEADKIAPPMPPNENPKNKLKGKNKGKLTKRQRARKMRDANLGAAKPSGLYAETKSKPAVKSRAGPWPTPNSNAEPITESTSTVRSETEPTDESEPVNSHIWGVKTRVRGS